MPPRRVLLSLVVAAALASPAAGGEPEKAPPAPTRQGLESLEAQLDHAVDRVSMPHTARLLGRGESARAYRLPGYGIVCVLTARALPGGEGPFYVVRGGGATRHRVRIEPRPSAPPEGTGVSDEEQEIEALERQVVVLQHETEAARRAAEEEMDRIVQDVRVRVASPSDVPVEVAPAEPAAPPAPSPAAAPLPPPPPPPWKFWFGTGLPEEKREPAAVVADVRVALVDALAALGGRLVGLGGEERLTVAVDFVVGGVFVAPARPERTLVVSARVRDVQARARGAITPDELRKRVEVTEY